MGTVHADSATLRFGPFVLDPTSQQFSDGGAPCTVEPKVFAALHHLARHPRKLVTREELLGAVWPDVVVSDDSVSQVVRKVRQLLRDPPRAPEWVETVHGKGYRFVGAVHSRDRVVRPSPWGGDVFVGRQPLLARLADALDGGTRLITLLGPGGTGKTRLATRYLHVHGARWGTQAWFADCASSRNADQLAFAVANAVGVPLTARREPWQHLADVLTQRGKALLVLDNLEQVVDPARELVALLLDDAPSLSLVGTSRIPLGLPVERTLPVGPLSAEAAAELFIARADPHGTLLPDAAAVAELVQRLECDPLSIELAASRASFLSPEQLVERLGARLSLLERPGVTSRHGSLRNNLDWTWDLLDEDQKALLVQLAAFQTGFTLRAAEAVVEVPSGAWAGDVLQALADRSLITGRAPGPRRRLRMPEALRQYCVERAGADRDLTLRQAEFLAEAGEQLAHAFAAGDDDGLLEILPDLRPAFDAVVDTHPDLAARLALAIHQARHLVGPYRLGTQALDRALDAGPDDDLTVRLLCARAGYRDDSGAPRALLERAQALAHASGAPAHQVLVQGALADRALADGRLDEALELFRKAADAARAAHATHDVARFLAGRAHALRAAGRFDAATECAAEALAMAPLPPRLHVLALQAKALADHRAGRLDAALAAMDTLESLTDALGDTRARLTVQAFRAIHAMETGDTDAASRGYDAALVLARELGDAAFEGRILANRCVQQIFLGQWAEATGTARRALVLAARSGDGEIAAVAGVNLGVARVMAGDPDGAGEALRVVQQQAGTRFRGWAYLWDAVALAERGDAGPAERALDQARAVFADGTDPTALPASELAAAVLLARRGAWDAAAALAARHADASAHKLDLLRALLARASSEPAAP